MKRQNEGVIISSPFSHVQLILNTQDIMAETEMSTESHNMDELASINNIDQQEARGYGTIDMGTDVPMGLDGDEALSDLEDYDNNDGDDFTEEEYSDENDDDQRPVGTFDPFDLRFPRNELEQTWGDVALEFICDTVQTREDWECMVESICEPFSGWDGDYWRTRNWFNALDFDIQMEVWIQRNLGLRPGSRWILGPHDDQIPEMWNQYEAGRYKNSRYLVSWIRIWIWIYSAISIFCT